MAEERLRVRRGMEVIHRRAMEEQQRRDAAACDGSDSLVPSNPAVSCSSSVVVVAGECFLSSLHLQHCDSNWPVASISILG